jgi:hypothetical protein
MPRPTVYDVHVSRPLTQFSIAYRNGAYIAEEVAPVVKVQKKNDLFFIFPKQAWLRNRSRSRAPGTRFPRGDYPLITGSYVCINDAFSKEITDEERDNADMPLRLDVSATTFVTDALLMGRENRVANLISTSTNWASASTAATLWTNDSSDPFANIDACVDAVVSSIGQMPNVAVMSWKSWKAARNNAALLDRIKYTRPGGKLEATDLKNWFGFEKVLIGMSIVDSAQEGQTASNSFVWGNDFWCGYVTPNPSLEEPTALYTLQWGEREISRYRYEEEHVDLIAAQHYDSTVITASDSGAGYYNVS